MTMPISEFFDKKLDAPLHSIRQSWGAVTRDCKGVALAVWQDEWKKIDGRNAVRVLWRPRRPEMNPFSWNERENQIDMIRAGANCIMVMCRKKDNRTDSNDGRIASFNREDVFIGGDVLEHDGDLYLEIVDRIPVGEVLRN